MSTLETFVGQLTVGELVARAGISVTTLLDRVGPLGPSTQQVGLTRLAEGLRAQRDHYSKPKAKTPAAAAAPKPKAEKARFGEKIGNLASPAHRDRFDASIVESMRGEEPMKLDAIYEALPWSNKERGQVGRAMVRLKKAGLVSASGNTLSRIYKLVKN